MTAQEAVDIQRRHPRVAFWRKCDKGCQESTATHWSLMGSYRARATTKALETGLLACRVSHVRGRRFQRQASAVTEQAAETGGTVQTPSRCPRGGDHERPT